MKISVNARQPQSIIEQADEIKFNYQDRDAVIDYIEKYPDKTIIVELPKGVEIPQEFYSYAAKHPDFYICSETLNKPDNIKYYYKYSANSWLDLRTYLDAGVSQVLISGSLFFDLKRIRTLYPSLLVRVEPNFVDPIYSANAPIVPWIRPEDIELYSPYVDSLDFVAASLAEEATYLQVYKERKWPGNLALLIKNFKIQVDNRIVPPDFIKSRLRCGQRCAQPTGRKPNGQRRCKLCFTAFELACAIRKEYYEKTNTD